MKNRKRLEEEFFAKNSFRTTIRGLKVRGVYDTYPEAVNRAKTLQKLDPSFNVYVGQVGFWVPWDPEPTEVADQEYADDQLNQLMKKKQSGQTLTPAENQQLAQAQQGQPAMQKGGPVKKNMGGAMGSGRKQALATRASAASNEARNAQMARKPAPPKRGPAGAGFEAKPMVNKLSADKVEAMRDRMTTDTRKSIGTLSAAGNATEQRNPEADRMVRLQKEAEARGVQLPRDSGLEADRGMPMPAGKGSRDPRVPMVSGPPPMMKKGGLAAMPKGKKC
jgi:hypothetical protein